MYAKRDKWLALVAIITLLLALGVVTPVTAAAQPATTREGAGAPFNTVVEIAPNQMHWYMFKYAYDNSKKDNEPSEALVVLRMNVPGALSFSIETPGNLALPREDKDGHLRGPVGVGGPLSLAVHEHDGTATEIEQAKTAADEHGMTQDWSLLLWSGKTKANETFYVLVKNNRNFAVSYTLAITGPTVSFPATAQAAAASSSAAAAAVQPAAKRVEAGAPLKSYVSIGANQTAWYSFKYQPDKTKDPTEALVTLSMDNPGCLSFAIETTANLALPREDKDGHLRGPVGVGSPMSLRVHSHDSTEEEIDQAKREADEHGMLQDWKTLVWSGKTTVPETFYVIVKNERSFACTYKLMITGPAISFSQ